MSPDRHWPWNVLDLDSQTADKRAVKRAYAKLLKASDPEADPQGFQNLRQAYETALSFTAGQRQPRTLTPAAPPPKAAPKATEPEAPAPDAPVPPKQSAPPEQATKARPIETAQPIETAPDTAVLPDLIKQTQVLLAQDDLDADNWRPIFNNLFLLDFQQEDQYKRALLKAMNAHLYMGTTSTFAAIPGPWLDLIDDRFGWFSQGLDFQRQYPEHFELWKKLYAKSKTSGTTLERLRSEAAAKQDPKVPFYLRWWVFVLGYFGLLVAFG